MPFQVESYSIEALRRLLIQNTDASEAVVGSKLRSNYFEDYFKTLQVKTIVVERDYIDHDYIDDFAAY